MGVIGDAWGLLLKFAGWLKLRRRRGLIEALASQSAELDRRVYALKIRDGVLIGKTKSAARAASNKATQSSVPELSRQLGVLEGRASVPAPRKARLKDPKAD